MIFFNHSKKEKICWTILLSIWIVSTICFLVYLVKSCEEESTVQLFALLCCASYILFIYGIVIIYTSRIVITDTSLIISNKFEKTEYELSSIKELRHINHEYTERWSLLQRKQKDWYHEEQRSSDYWFAIMKNGKTIRLKIWFAYDSKQITQIQDYLKKIHSTIVIKHYNKDPINEMISNKRN